MKQNIYNNQTMFENYTEHRINKKGLTILNENTIKSLLPDLKNKKCLELGSGMGQLSKYMERQGAAEVLGIDISKKMTDYAKKFNSGEKIEFITSAIEDWEYPKCSFDIVVSSLAIDHIKDYQELVKNVRDTLKNKGMFIFSVEHPICTACLKGGYKDKNDKILHWPVDNYKIEGPRKQFWFVEDVISYHRPIEKYVSTLLKFGFQIRALLEPEDDENKSGEDSIPLNKRRPPILAISSQIIK